ncbi:hypothetical protein [Streptomyces cavourensis]|nr:hypothetical protein [Streptomyces cavourensis]
MATESDHLSDSAAADLPKPEALLRDTDWAALDHAGGTAEDIPTALTALHHPDPAVRARALEHGLEPVRHQNTIYPATLPVALYIAAILPDRKSDTVGTYTLEQRHRPEPQRLPLRAALLDWLHLLALDANDECTEITRRHGFEDPHMERVRSMRPMLFHAVAAFLRDEDPDVRHAALAAAVPLTEDPALESVRAELAPLAHELLAMSTDHRHRMCVIDGLRTWGHDVQDLEPPAAVRAQPNPCSTAGRIEAPPAQMYDCRMEVGRVPELLERVKDGDNTEAWDELEDRLVLEYDLVSPASFTALPHLVRLATSSTRARSLAGWILRRAAGHHGCDDLLAGCANAIAEYRALLDRHMQSRPADYLETFIALLAVMEQYHWAAALGDFTDDFYELPCPHCAVDVTVAIGDHGRYAAIRDWHLGDVDRRDLRPATPGELSGTGHWMYETAVRDSQGALADGITYLFGKAECPSCASVFSIADEYGSANLPILM